MSKNRLVFYHKYSKLSPIDFAVEYDGLVVKIESRLGAEEGDRRE